MNEILPLTTLRFCAASLVFLAHAHMIRGMEWMNVGEHTGRAGVAIFFVLSGFILSYTYSAKDWRGDFVGNARKFYWSRVARIYPLHWLVFLIALPLGLNSTSMRVNVADFPWLLTLTDKLWPGVHFGPQPAFVSWTLSCEVLFYLITPFVFLLLLNRSNRLAAASVLLVCYGCVVFTVAARFPEANWLAYLRVPDFLLGIVAYQLFLRVRFERFSWLLCGAGSLLLAAPACLADAVQKPLGVLYNFELAPGAMLLVLGVASCNGSLKQMLSHPFLVLLGQASYASYLLHDPVLRYTRYILIKLGVVVPGPLGPVVALILFGVVTVFAVVCFKFYENPVRLKLRALMSSKTSQAKRAPKRTETIPSSVSTGVNDT